MWASTRAVIDRPQVDHVLEIGEGTLDIGELLVEAHPPQPRDDPDGDIRILRKDRSRAIHVPSGASERQ